MLIDAAGVVAAVNGVADGHSRLPALTQRGIPSHGDGLPGFAGAVFPANPRTRPIRSWLEPLSQGLVALVAIACAFAMPVAAAELPDLVARIKPSIVAVGTYLPTRSPRFAFRGTGFVVGDGTLIATNAHVVPDTIESEKLEVISVVASAAAGASEPQVREAKLVGLDRDHDLALLRISGAALPALKIGDSASVREGESIAFTGFPIGNTLGFLPVTHRGIVASITPVAIPGANAQQLDPRVIRRVQAGAFDVFQLDATAYPGNSGSPVYDLDTGEVRGIINMVFVKGTKEAALSNPTGISFAIPAAFLQALISSAQR